MRLGLYGLPCAGKSYVLNEIDCMKVIEGSATMKKMFPDFDSFDDAGKNNARFYFAEWLESETDFIMDGHYSFGDKTAFTEADGKLYDAFLYLYIDPDILRERMRVSEKNKKYMALDIHKWQRNEITALRKYCHQHDKDFFVIDHPEKGCFDDVSTIAAFIKDVHEGFSCLLFAERCAEEILNKEQGRRKITLADGDKTITVKDTSNLVYGYTTHIFDNNFYTGYQSWLHWKNHKDYAKRKQKSSGVKTMDFEFNDKVVSNIGAHSYILTSGDGRIWKTIADDLSAGLFWGNAMSADTKFFVAKFLRKAGKYVTAYGDSMNDYYMLSEADEGYLIAKPSGTLSRSLRIVDLGGIHIV